MSISLIGRAVKAKNGTRNPPDGSTMYDFTMVFLLKCAAAAKERSQEKREREKEREREREREAKWSETESGGGAAALRQRTHPGGGCTSVPLPHMTQCTLYSTCTTRKKRTKETFLQAHHIIHPVNFLHMNDTKEGAAALFLYWPPHVIRGTPHTLRIT